MRYGFVVRLQACVVALATVGVAGLALAGGASAETYNVKNTLQFEEAVSNANANPGANTITLAAAVYQPIKAVTFTNTSGVLTIQGPSGLPSQKLETAKLDGADVAEELPPVKPPHFGELFVIEPGVSVTFKNVEITHGGRAGVATIEDFGTLSIESSAVAGNTGTGIVVQPAATATLRNSTLSDDISSFGLVNDGTASFFNSTVAFNKGGGLENQGTLNLTNTIVAENTGAGDCEGKATTSDHSLDSNGSCGVGALSKTNPLLQTSLLNDGGSTPLHSLTKGSPAISAGDTATCTTSDQRGAPRPGIAGKPCSLGADEYNETPPVIKTPAEITTSTTSPEGAVVTYTAEATSADDLVRTFSCSPSSGSKFAIGTTTVTCTAVDGHENTATASFNITVVGVTGAADPSEVAVGPSGNIYVADIPHSEVLEFNKAREPIGQFGEEGSGEGQFRWIGGIATDTSGNVYVTDSHNDRVEEFSETGKYEGQFGSASQLRSPGAIAIDPSGDVWVVNTYDGYRENDRIVEFNPKHEYVSGFGREGSAKEEIGWVYGLAFSEGDLYLAEFSNDRVQEFSTSGKYIRQFDEAGTAPYGVATGPGTGNLYVTDNLGDRVQEFSPSGSLITAFGSAGSGAGQFRYPQGVAVSSSGTVYVADRGNERVQEWVLGDPPAMAAVPAADVGGTTTPSGSATTGPSATTTPSATATRSGIALIDALPTLTGSPQIGAPLVRQSAAVGSSIQDKSDLERQGQVRRDDPPRGRRRQHLYRR